MPNLKFQQLPLAVPISTDIFPFVSDPSGTPTDKKTTFAAIQAAVGGVVSINTDATAAQLLTTGTAGTDFAITDPGSGSHVFNLPVASAVNTGKLSSTDWSTFNSKIGGSGVSQQIAFFNGVSSVTGDAAFRWDTSTHRLAIGGDASLTTAGYIWDISQTITDLSATTAWFAFHNQITLNPSNDTSSTIFLQAIFKTNLQAGNTKNFSRLQSLEAYVQQDGSGNITGQITALELNAVHNGSGTVTRQTGTTVAAIAGTSCTGTITVNDGVRINAGSGSVSAHVVSNRYIYLQKVNFIGTIDTNFGILMDDMGFGTLSRAIEITGSGIGNAIRFSSSANIYGNAANNIRMSDSTNVGGLDINLTTTSTTINSVTQNNASIILQNQTFTAGAQHLAVSITPTWATENQNHVALSLSATQNGANTQLLVGQLISLTKATTATTLNQATGILILGTNATGTVTTSIGISIGNESTVGGTSAFAIQISNQSSNATTTRAIELAGQGVSNAIRFGSSVNVYNNGANVLGVTDSTNADGLSFTLVASGAQKIGTMVGGLSLTAATGVVAIVTSRHELTKGVDVVSANNMVLGSDGNTFTITGTTTINTISATNWQAGSMITLIFSGILTVSNNAAGTGASIFLAGSLPLATATNTILGLIYDGTQWQETYRKAA